MASIVHYMACRPYLPFANRYSPHQSYAPLHLPPPCPLLDGSGDMASAPRGRQYRP